MAVLDTIGYAHTGPREDQMPATQNAAQQSDVLLLVMQARNPARQPDRGQRHFSALADCGAAAAADPSPVAPAPGIVIGTWIGARSNLSSFARWGCSAHAARLRAEPGKRPRRFRG